MKHDRSEEHPHVHPHGHGEYGHTHGAVDPTVATSERGIWAIKWSFVGLMVTALLQLVVVLCRAAWPCFRTPSTTSETRLPPYPSGSPSPLPVWASAGASPSATAEWRTWLVYSSCSSSSSALLLPDTRLWRGSSILSP